MKAFRNVASALILFAATATGTAAVAKTHQTVVTAQSAADANRRMQLIEQSLTEEGYKLSNVSEQAIPYFVQPQAPYDWGQLVYTYTRIVPGHFQMVERVEVTAQVTTTADGYTFPQITIHELLSQ
jgi:hypothetical protein